MALPHTQGRHPLLPLRLHNHPIRGPLNVLLHSLATGPKIPHRQQKHLGRPRPPKMDWGGPGEKGRRRRNVFLTYILSPHHLMVPLFSVWFLFCSLSFCFALFCFVLFCFSLSFDFQVSAIFIGWKSGWRHHKLAWEPD